ncbi:MAG: hypothetical protein SZ59_C0002G0377 [candidate division TM6 bacterium GW2011_GWF2_28_16]|nr:MAG: hypothetical protein SZ59_C0002G0377 [candidate division TM6 bacterium GW2011_GWF2_28_16]
MKFLNKKILILFLSLLTLNNFSFGSIRKKLERRRAESPNNSRFNRIDKFMFDKESLDIIGFIAQDEIQNVSVEFKGFCSCIYSYLNEQNSFKNVEIESYIDGIVENLVNTRKLSFDTFNSINKVSFKKLWTQMYNNLKNEALSLGISWSETFLMQEILNDYNNEQENFVLDDESLNIINEFVSNIFMDCSNEFRVWGDKILSNRCLSNKYVSIEKITENIIIDFVKNCGYKSEDIGFKVLWTELYKNLKDEAISYGINWLDTNLMQEIVDKYDIAKDFVYLSNDEIYSSINTVIDIVKGEYITTTPQFRSLCEKVLEYYLPQELQETSFEIFISERVADLVFGKLGDISEESIEFFEEWLVIYTLLFFEAKALGIGEFIFPSNDSNTDIIGYHLKGAGLTKADFIKKFNEQYLKKDDDND